MGYKETYENRQENEEIVNMVEIEETQVADDTEIEVEDVREVIDKEIKHKNYLYLVAGLIAVIIIVATIIKNVYF